MVRIGSNTQASAATRRADTPQAPAAERKEVTPPSAPLTTIELVPAAPPAAPAWGTLSVASALFPEAKPTPPELLAKVSETANATPKSVKDEDKAKAAPTPAKANNKPSASPSAPLLL